MEEQDYIVSVKEVYIESLKVKASSKKEAIKKIENGEGEFINDSLQFSHTLSPRNWTVQQIST